MMLLIYSFIDWIIDWLAGRFRYLAELASLVVHSSLTTVIATYMPELVELELQPQVVVGYKGLSPTQVGNMETKKIFWKKNALKYF